MSLEPELKTRIEELEIQCGLKVKPNEPLSRYCSARIGGTAEYLLEVTTAAQLAKVITVIWNNQIPYILLGSGSNVLISDRGLSGLVVINRARGRGRIKVTETDESVAIWAESGVNLGTVARLAAENGLSGLEWAVGIPGTIGGAVVNNAGAFDGDIAHSLIVAEILQRIGEPVSEIVLRQRWTVADFEYSYRNSRLKRQHEAIVVLGANLKVWKSDVDIVKAKMNEFNERRKNSQPAGASMGSIFKNPVGDYAGRLIEEAGLKGRRVGGAQISPAHANFIVNNGNACAQDVYELIQMARDTVYERFGVTLELEIQILGDFLQIEKRTVN
ncbi:MAG: UDP-N-acetylmuramate dehydrogenase [Anaerolineales bacterium]